MTTIIDQTMEQAVERGIFPSASLLVGHQGEIVHTGFYGEASKETHYDIASLTKPICTATLCMLFAQEKKIALTDTLPQWLASAKRGEHKAITLLHLLSHTSGLPAWRPYYREIPQEKITTQDAKNFIIQACLGEPIFSKPGQLCEYSDLGYILLGTILEEAGGKSLEKLFDEKIAKPIGSKNTFFIPLPEKNKKNLEFAPTEDCPWRKKIVRSAVHDYNAYAMGGVAGHSGLFSIAQDIHQYIVELLKCYKGESDWISQEIVKKFIEDDTKTLNHQASYVLGWDTPHFATSSAGNYFSPHSIGHLGYTGCSLWIDLDKDFWVILLTNRVHPSVANTKIKTFRPRIHNLAYKEFLG